jgi:putative hemolysin
LEPDPDSCLALAAFPLMAADPALVFGVLLFPVLLILSALVSGSEVAFFSLRLSDLETLKEERKESGRRILALLEKPASLLATILISNNFINISIVLVSEVLLRRLLPVDICTGWAMQLHSPWLALRFTPEVLGEAFHFTITVVGVTVILVLMGEIMPKIYARLNTLSLARHMAGPLSFLMRMFSPVSRIMVRWTDVLEQRLAHLSNDGGHSPSDLQSAIEMTVQDGLHGRKEVDILKRIIQFADVNAKQIMRPRTDIVAIGKEAHFGELMKVVRSSGYSRIPVFEDDLDHILGIIYAKDLIGHIHQPEEFAWHELVRTEVLYVPESKRISDLLKEFQKERRHMAIVVDEYGGTAGLVTLEDIMEEIVGEIKDEFDDEVEITYTQLDERNFIFEGKAQINDVCRILGLDVTTFDEVKGDADSLAGLVLELAGVIPRKDTMVEFAGYSFRVTRVNKRRIEEIKLTRPPLK